MQITNKCAASKIIKKQIAKQNKQTQKKEKLQIKIKNKKEMFSKRWRGWRRSSGAACPCG